MDRRALFPGLDITEFENNILIKHKNHEFLIPRNCMLELNIARNIFRVIETKYKVINLFIVRMGYDKIVVLDLFLKTYTFYVTITLMNKCHNLFLDEDKLKLVFLFEATGTLSVKDGYEYTYKDDDASFILTTKNIYIICKIVGKLFEKMNRTDNMIVYKNNFVKLESNFIFPKLLVLLNL